MKQVTTNIVFTAMGRRIKAIALALAAIGYSHVSQAQPEEIVVTATAPAKISTHVSSLIATSRDNQIARWHNNFPLCLNAPGLNEATSERLHTHISGVAEQVALSVNTEDCRPNVSVFFTGDADTFTKQLVERLKVPIRRDGTESARRVLENHGPVRWIGLVDRYGFSNISPNSTLPNSRLQRASAPRIANMYLVVDLEQIKSHNFNAIADYIAFVILANPAEDATPPMSSILGLFAENTDDDKPRGLTLYDDVYLEALYAIEMDRDGKQQQRAIADRMLAGLSRTQE